MRSVVLVTMDSLRYDHCSFAGHDRETTPTLDAMAEDGLVYETAVSPGPSTPESMPAVLTGSYPVDAGVDADSTLARRRERLRRHMRARETLADRFSRRGYATAGFSPNPYTSRYFGFDAGFDRYEDFVGGSRERLYEGALDRFEGTPLSALFPARLLLNWVQLEEVFKPWEAFYDRVTAWLDGVDGPYFLWVLLMDTHDPYLVPDGYRTGSRWATYHANWRLWRQGHEPPFSGRTHDRLVRAYDDAVRYADDFLARLRGDLPGDPLVAVQGDHGEAFGEHGTYGHHARLYEENVRVPFVVGGGPDRSIAAPVSLDRTPEVLTALSAGEQPPEPEPPARTRTLDGERLAVRGRDWKYLARVADGRPVEERLFDLSADPGERDPVADAALAAPARRLSTGWLADRAERDRIARATDEVVE